MKLKQKTFKEMTDDDKLKNPGYASFLEKFEYKYTSDDCFTPANIYECVSDYVSSKYNLDSAQFVRPFYPGGDYENFDYDDDCIVVDNPPFSILSKIVRFYSEHNIKFFLFAPSLTILCVCHDIPDLTYIIVDTSIVYENGANVATSFITNLEKSACIKSDPELDEALNNINSINSRKKSKKLLKYNYPTKCFDIFNDKISFKTWYRYNNRSTQMSVC